MKTNPWYRTSVGMLSLVASLLVSGCGGDSQEDSRTIPPPQETAPDGSRLDPAAVDFKPLENSENPVVANNAKRLTLAFENNDYTQAAFSLSTMASLRLSSSEESAIQKALVALNSAATIAANAGDGNAQFAVNHLKETFGQ